MSDTRHPYELLEVVAHGGSGTVHLAREKKTGREVALKLLKHHLPGDTSAARFRAEARIIASLDHPHIVPIYDAGDLDGRPYFTMKLLHGGNLNEHLASYHSPKKAAALIRQIALAVHHAHQRGILHRDLKPSNILLDQKGTPFLSDFGIARIEDNSDSPTLHGAILGTPAYMSPEQASGENATLTTASDIFSLGAILFRLLSGRPAFPGENAHLIMKEVIATDPVFTSRELKKSDRDLAAICLKCLHKDPEARYRSARALAEELAAWQRGEPLLARPMSRFQYTRYWLRHHPIIVGFLALLLLLLSIYGWWTGSRWWAAKQAHTITWNFDESLEGWEHVSTSGSGAGEFIVSSPRLFFDSLYDGDRFLCVKHFLSRDAPQKNTLWLRSPEFSLPSDQDTRITFHLLGGANASSRGRVSIPKNENHPYLANVDVNHFWKGLVLRRVRDGHFLLHGERSSSSEAFFEKITWSEKQIAQATAGDSPDEKYTLDLIDNHNGAWSWIALNNVNIERQEK